MSRWIDDLEYPDGWFAKGDPDDWSLERFGETVSSGSVPAQYHLIDPDDPLADSDMMEYAFCNEIHFLDAISRSLSDAAFDAWLNELPEDTLERMGWRGALAHLIAANLGTTVAYPKLRWPPSRESDRSD